MHNRFKIFISIVVIAMFLGTGLASDRGTADIASSNAAEALLPAFGEVVNTWSLSGKTCAPSSASSESTVALKIDVTSFSESSGAGPTVMYFIVNGKKIHSTDVDGTGVYTYNWSPAYANTTVSFHAEYLSRSEFFDRPSMHYAEKRPMVFFRNSYSTFGNSGIYIKWLQDCHRYMGYEGNNKIYLSSNISSFNSIYGYFNLSHSESSVNNCFSSSSAHRYENDSISMEVTYDIVENRINIYIVNSGVSNDLALAYPKSTSKDYTAYYVRSGLTTNNAMANTSVQLCQNFNQGLNVTGSKHTGTTIEQAQRNVALKLFGYVPYAGNILNSASLVNSLYQLSGVECYSSNTKGDGSVYQNFLIDGGNNGISSGPRQNAFSSIEKISIVIPSNDLSHSFSINAFSTNYYEYGSTLNVLKSANATQTINALTASAIYGTVGCTSAHADPNLTIHNIYIKNINNRTFYKVPIVNGNYLFYGKPDTEYEMCYYDKSTKMLTQFYHDNSDNKPVTFGTFDTGSPGSSASHSIFIK